MQFISYMLIRTHTLIAISEFDEEDLLECQSRFLLFFGGSSSSSSPVLSLSSDEGITFVFLVLLDGI